MVARSGGYFGIPFKGYHGMTQGKPLYPTLLNVVMDAIICHWVTVLAPTKEGREGLGLYIQDSETYFYANDGLVALTQPERIYRAFDVLSGLFDQVSLKTNTHKKVSIACQPCHTPERMLVE